jgi:hypothetical protein
LISIRQRLDAARTRHQRFARCGFGIGRRSGTWRWLAETRESHDYRAHHRQRDK